MKILTVTTLYPNAIQYRHGIFVENRLRQLRAKYPNIELTVIAPVPYFPITSKHFGEYSKFAQVPKMEERFGVKVYHPRYLVIPKIGMYFTPFFLYLALKKMVKVLVKSGYDFDLIDCHYFYPDGVAVTKLANELGKPITVTARGSDITLLPNFPKVRRKIQAVLRNMSAGIGVSKALVDEMKKIEPNHKPIHVIRNGVDLTLFKPPEKREVLREKLNIKGFTLLMVGNLVELKGHKLAIKALQHLPNISLCIIGEGVLDTELKTLTKQLNLQARVNFVGGLKQTQLPDYYAAADCLLLASSREGWPNVLLESMACGTPVIATKVWGTPEVVAKPEAGILIERSIEAVVKGVTQFIDRNINRTLTRKYAEGFSWDETSHQQYKLFASLGSREAS